MKGFGQFYGSLVETPSGDGFTTFVHTNDMWHLMAGAKNVICADGKERTFYAKGQPSTVWDQPGYVRAKGKTVTGYIIVLGEPERWTFTATGKNANVIDDNATKGN